MLLGGLESMRQSTFTYVYDVCVVRETQYSIGVRVDPSINNVESFAVILFFEQRDGTRVEVAKVDDSPHQDGEIHVDRYYRELGSEVKTFDVDIDNHVDAEDHLRENCTRFGRLYHRNHGQEVRADGANA